MNNFVKKCVRDQLGKFACIDLPINEIVRLYNSGWPKSKIAKKYRVSRSVIRKRLESRNIHIRNQSEAIKNLWSQMSQSEKDHQVEAAHKASCGKTISWETKCKHAQAIEKKPSNFSQLELQVQEMLSKRGIETVHQKAIGAYNCDLAAYPVGVEVWSGNWHFTSHHLSIFEERFRYLLNAGWFVYILPVTKRFPLTEAVADYVASYIERIRRAKSSVTEYRMVWGAGEFTFARSLDDNDFTIIPPFANARDPASGRYKTIPK